LRSLPKSDQRGEVCGGGDIVGETPTRPPFGDAWICNDRRMKKVKNPVKRQVLPACEARVLSVAPGDGEAEPGVREHEQRSVRSTRLRSISNPRRVFPHAYRIFGFRHHVSLRFTWCYWHSACFARLKH